MKEKRKYERENTIIRWYIIIEIQRKVWKGNKKKIITFSSDKSQEFLTLRITKEKIETNYTWNPTREGEWNPKVVMRTC